MSKEIKCPQCGSVISMDGAVYDSVARQIRDAEFNEEIAKRQEEMDRKVAELVKLTKAQKDSEKKDELAAKDAEILRLQQEKDSNMLRANNSFVKQKNEYEIRMRAKEAEIIELRKELSLRESMQDQAVSAAVAQERKETQDEIQQKELKIVSLTERLSRREVESDAEVARVKNQYEKQIADMKAKMAMSEMAHVNSETAMKEKCDVLLRAKEEELAFYKDFKARQSVKLLGESLEEHCNVEFSKIRSLMPNATFEKDNVVSLESRSKGDFIFRDSEGGLEYISIMFDMKHEADGSARKHKNEDYLKELDKDRFEKNCEYAVLVSTLEADNEIYNQGIVDMSHRYSKMFIIRPQFFVPLIMILRNAARKSLEYKELVEEFKNQNRDLTNFETNLEEFKEDIFRSVKMAGKKKDSAIEKLDKAIGMLQQIKEEFVHWDKYMAQAGKKAEKVTTKKLTKNAPGVIKMLESDCEHKSVNGSKCVEALNSNSGRGNDAAIGPVVGDSNAMREMDPAADF